MEFIVKIQSIYTFWTNKKYDWKWILIIFQTFHWIFQFLLSRFLMYSILDLNIQTFRLENYNFILIIVFIFHIQVIKALFINLCLIKRFLFIQNSQKNEFISANESLFEWMNILQINSDFNIWNVSQKPYVLFRKYFNGFTPYLLTLYVMSYSKPLAHSITVITIM